MPSIENKIIDLLLTKVRKSAPRPLVSGSGTVPGPSGRLERTVTKREVRFRDFEAVAALKRRVGLPPDSRKNWQRLWRDNPALAGRRQQSCMGWVLEADEKIVGYLGSIPLLYHYANKTLNAAVASGFATDRPYRAFSLGLVASFYRQEDVDLFLNTTAIEAVGKIMSAFKADPLPQKDYDTVLFWVLDPNIFCKALIQKLNTNATFVKIGSVLGSLALHADVVLRNRLPGGIASRLHISETSVSEIGDDFQGLWLKKLKERPRLLADRTPAVLRWHFEISEKRQSTRVLRCDSSGRLAGYAIVTNEVDTEIGLRRAVLADLLVEDDDPRITERLLTAAYEDAKGAGIHILEVLGFPRNIRQICLQWKPYARKYPACPFFYRARDQELHRKLEDEDMWYACPFDGDTTLSP